MSETKTCRKCKHDKPIGEMALWAGKPGSICQDCKGGKRKASKRRPKPAAEAEPAGPEPLTMKPGFGFTAGVDGEQLAINQANSEGKVDNVTLSRTEARVLFAQFHDWALAEG